MTLYFYLEVKEVRYERGDKMPINLILIGGVFLGKMVYSNKQKFLVNK